MSPYQRFLLDVTRLGTPMHTDDDGTWYAVVIGDHEELGHTRSTIGCQLKIDGTPGDLVVRDYGTYSR